MNKPSLREMILYFLKLGTIVFGGPIVLCEDMRRELVERKKWISPEEYTEGFALSQLAPGPLATQLAIYLGWARGGVPWATYVGIAFILPSLLMVLILALLYMNYGGLPWIQGAFYGIGASVIAIIATSAYKLVTKTFNKDWLLWSIGMLSAGITIATESENLLVFLGAGVLVAMVKVPPRIFRPVAIFILPSMMLTGLQGEAPATLPWTIFLFFAKAGALVFGSGLAIVPFLHSGVVLEHHWLTERQFLDAVAVAMITPGPVVITVAFIGCLVAGIFGGLMAALGVFLPCYLFVVIPAPHYKRIAKNATINAFVGGVTAAAIGAIAGAAVILGKRALLDWVTVLIAAATLLLLLQKKCRIPEPILLLVAGVIGFLWKGL
jgi:chromate transporter